MPQIYKTNEWPVLLDKIQNHEISSIDLSDNDLDDKGANELQQAICHDWHITSIDLKNNCINENIIKEIDEIIKRNQGLVSLYDAIDNNDFEKIKLLDSLGININEAHQDLSSPLHLAAYGGYTEIVDFMIMKNANVNLARYDGLTPLYFAAQNGHEKVVQILIDQHADINAKDNKGWSALQIAALSGHENITKRLLAEGADINAKDNKGWTTLHLAAQKDEENLVLNLIDHGADIDSKTNNDCTPLYIAAQNGHEKVVQILIDQGANINAETTEGCKPLYIAAVNGHEKVVKILLDRGADINNKDEDGCTALHVAAQNGHDNVVQTLLDRHADINAKNNMGWTALHEAAQKGHESVIKCLLAAGADKDNKDNEGWTALHIAVGFGQAKAAQSIFNYSSDFKDKDDQVNTALLIAAEQGHVEMAQMFIEHGADVKTKERKRGWTALHFAAANNNENVLKCLLAAGADKDSKENDGSTALHIAAQNGYENIVKCLIAADADKEAKQNDGCTALHFAAQNGKENVVKYLIAGGVDINAKENGGWTALHIAAQNGYENVVKCLIEAGANKDSKENDGWTALHIAAENNNENVVKCLIAEGADKKAKNNDGWTALHIAAGNNNENVVKCLIAEGADINVKDNDGWTALHIAAAYDYEKVVKTLLENNADINIKNDDGNTPLDEAISNENIKCIRILVNAEEFSQEADSWSDLHWAAANGNERCISLLIQKDADINEKDKDGKTPLYLAALNDKIKCLRILIENGANFNENDENAQNLLHEIALKGQVECVKLLMEKITHNTNSKTNSDLTTQLYTTSYFNRSLLKEKTGDLNGAIYDCEEGLKIEPQNPSLLKKIEDLNGRIKDVNWGWKKLIKSIRHNDAELVQLKINKDKNYERYSNKIINAVKRNHVIKEINCEGWPLSESEFDSFSKVIQNNRLIEKFTCAVRNSSKKSIDILSEIKNSNSLKELHINFDYLSQAAKESEDIENSIDKLAVTARNALVSNTIVDATINVFEALKEFAISNQNQQLNEAIISVLNENQCLEKLTLRGIPVDVKLYDGLISVLEKNYILNDLNINRLIPDSDCKHEKVMMLIERNKNLIPLREAIKNNDIQKIEEYLNNKYIPSTNILIAPWVIKILSDEVKDELIVKILNYILDLESATDGISPVWIKCKNGLFEINNDDAILQGDAESKKQTLDESSNKHEENKQELNKKIRNLTKEESENLIRIIQRIRSNFEESQNNNKEFYINPQVGMLENPICRYNIDEKIDDFINDNTKLSLLMLGDAGLGKTVFCQKLAMMFWEKWGQNPNFDNLIPIHISLKAIYNQNPTPTQMIEPDVLRQKGLLEYYLKNNYCLTSDEINYLKEKCQKGEFRLLIILDCFDELIPLPSQSIYDTNGWFQNWGAPKVITASRPEAFHKIDHYERLFYPNQENKNISQLFLQPFTNEQIERYIDHFKQEQHLSGLDIIFKIKRLNEIATNPFVLKMLVKIIPELKESFENKLILKYRDISDVVNENEIHLFVVKIRGEDTVFWKTSTALNLINEYELNTKQKECITRIKGVLNDELRKAEIDDADLSILQSLKQAPNILKNSVVNITLSKIYEQFIDKWLDEQTSRILSDPVKYNRILNQYITHNKDTLFQDLKCCLKNYLIRLTFNMLIKNKGQLENYFTDLDTLDIDLMYEGPNIFEYQYDPEKIKFLLEIIRTGCLLTCQGGTYKIMHKSILEHFLCREIYKYVRIRATLSKADKLKQSTLNDFYLNEHLLINEPNVINLLADLTKNDDNFKNQLYDLIADSRKYNSLSTAAANAITILKTSGENFSQFNLNKLHRSFKGINISGADLSGAFLDGTDLSNATLKNVDFRNAWLRHSNFSGSDLFNAKFTDSKNKQNPDIKKMLYDKDGQEMVFFPTIKKVYFCDENKILNLPQEFLHKYNRMPVCRKKSMNFRPITFHDLQKEELSADEFTIQLERKYKPRNKKVDFKGVRFHIEVRKEKFDIDFDESYYNFYKLFSPNRKTMVVGASKKNGDWFNYPSTKLHLITLNPTSNRPQKQFISLWDKIRSIQFSQDNRFLIMTGKDNIYIWDVETNKMHKTIYTKNKNSNIQSDVQLVTMSDNNELIAILDKSGNLSVLNQQLNTIYQAKLLNELNCSQISDIYFEFENGNKYLIIIDNLNNKYTYNTENKFSQIINKEGQSSFNCYGMNFNESFNIDFKTEKFLLQNGACGQNADENAFERKELKNKIELTPPICCSSNIKPDLLLTPAVWIISIVRNNRSEHSEHAYILMEKMNERGEISYIRSEITTSEIINGQKKNVTPGYAKVKFKESNPVYYKNTAECQVALNKILGKNNVHHQYGKGWTVHFLDADKLYKNIKAEAEIEIPFHYTGKGTLLGQRRHNCFTWAQEKVSMLKQNAIDAELNGNATFFDNSAVRLFVNNPTFILNHPLYQSQQNMAESTMCSKPSLS